MSTTKIVAKEVTKNKQHKGWKVYIDGSKFPKKPVDFYTGLTESEAMAKAMEEWITLQPIERFGKAPGKAVITDSCEHPVNVPQPIKILQIDRLFADSSLRCLECSTISSPGKKEKKPKVKKEKIEEKKEENQK